MPTEADFLAQAVDLATANVLDGGGRILVDLPVVETV